MASAPAGGGEDAAQPDAYARGARILSVGIATTGVFTFAYFAVGSHVLSKADYDPVAQLWTVLFLVMSVIYRPVEQLLSRTIAARRAQGLDAGSLRTPITIQAAFAALFLVAALALRGPIEDDLLDGSSALYWVLVVAALAYAASYFARGYVAGHQWFGLYGGLVLFESLSRFAFPVAVAVGIASGQTAVALGIAAAPLASLVVIPWAFARRGGGGAAAARERGDLREGAGFAGSVAVIQAAEQTLVNAGVLLVGSTVGLAGAVFNAFMITRAPLQLFQVVQTSLLPHLAGMDATADRGAFDKAIRQTVLLVVAFAGSIAVGLLAVGPWAMDLLFGEGYDYGRGGLALVAVGMGLHLTAGTLNQAALARGRAAQAAGIWALAAVVFVVWMLVGVIDDEVLRAEAGYPVAAGLLCALLWRLDRRAYS
ncbi:lipopolysaccharide biosynthesis protein [Conexibacter sp. SYSU D00693]|uniref:lipopolysaccharide biosynthesis protein n=1 Tax=Conexibacter sp. SYSU D00693 TaxID=2812560 RepID=UPI00196B582A|nr:hypothetical protein [Conexibacter sp. SYSU D00693]